MSDPITRPDGSRLRYAERDVIGVDASGTPAGINAELDWLRSRHPVQTREHTAWGFHDSPQIARAFIAVSHPPLSPAPVVDAPSYLGALRGANAADVHHLGPGFYSIVLATPMVSDQMRIADATTQVLQPGSVHGGISGGDPSPWPQVMFVAAVSSVEFTVRRYTVHGPNTATFEDGDFQILVYSG